jgi:hypothetical protein
MSAVEEKREEYAYAQSWADAVADKAERAPRKCARIGMGEASV